MTSAQELCNQGHQKWSTYETCKKKKQANPAWKNLKPTRMVLSIRTLVCRLSVTMFRSLVLFRLYKRLLAQHIASFVRWPPASIDQRFTHFHTVIFNYTSFCYTEKRGSRDQRGVAFHAPIQPRRSLWIKPSIYSVICKAIIVSKNRSMQQIIWLPPLDKDGCFGAASRFQLIRFGCFF